MLSAVRRPPVKSRRGEAGFTLIEILVSLTILGLIASAIAGAFSVGIHTVAPGGARDRLAGAGDLAVLEQLLGKDGARATCITAQDPTSGTWTIYGMSSSPVPTCTSTTGYAKVPGCSSSPPPSGLVLCIGWVQMGTTAPAFLDSTCHVAVYSTKAPVAPATPAATGAIVVRTEYSVPLSGSSVVTGQTVDRFDTIKLAAGTAAPAGYKPPGESYAWLRTLPITITATGVAKNQPTQTLALHPVAVDPNGAAAAVTTSGSPC